jgi:ubiquitin-conjugating enzyme E2 Z
MRNIKRIISDIIEFREDPPENIHIEIDKTDITNIKALIIGPKGTPYEDGYFFFTIKMPHNYPDSSPFVTFKTIDGKIRFHPNLYQCGKVCLSLLGTWSGPEWTSANTLTSVLLSIQSLMSYFPIHNEPGYEKVPVNDNKSIHYNYYVTYHKFRLALIAVLNKQFIEFECFDDIIKDHFNKVYLNHLNNLLSLTQIFSISQSFTSPIYFIKGTFNINYPQLLKKFNKLDKNNIESIINETI